MAVLAVDIGGTNIRTATCRSPTDMAEPAVIENRALGIPVPVKAFVEYVGYALEAATGADPIEAIGIAVAAVVDHRTGYVKVGENVGWRDVPLQSILEMQWRVPVRVDVDAYCGALAEARLGAGSDLEHFLYVVIGTGIGHGLVLNGRVWHGLHAAANVFGHLKVQPGGEPCYCGGAGCLCQYASGKGIARLGRQATHAERAVLSAREVVSAYKAGERWAQEAVAEAMERLACSLSSAYNLLDIECAILGGGVVSADFPNLAQLQVLLEPLVYPEIRPIVLRRAALGERAVLTGAALLAFDAFETKGEEK